MDCITAECVGKDRFVLGNDLIRLDFDLRTSDTMYNYIWVRSHQSKKFERLYNFGCDVGARERGTRETKNAIGVKLKAEPTLDQKSASIRLTYPAPLLIYRQLEKAKDLASIWNYPDLPDPLPDTVRVCDASLAVTYTVKAGEAAFETSTQHLGGVIECTTPILNAMWVDNSDVPETMYLEDVGEFDWNRPARLSHFASCDVRYALFYNRDGRGVPYGLVIHGRQKQSVFPHAGTPIGADIFYLCSTNQEFKPKKVPTERFNDTNISCPMNDSRITPPMRWLLFPEFANGRGGTGAKLLDNLRQQTEEKHCGWWAGATRQPSAELFFCHYPMYKAPPTLWR